MTREELLDLLRTELPRLLQEDPMFRAQVIGVLSEVLVSKGEMTRVLEELRAMRAESEHRFRIVEERFAALDARFEALIQEMREMREDFERRFEASEARFQAMREDLERRFEASEARFQAMREDFERRFEASEARFQAMREDLERRFEASEARFQAMREDFERRFEAIDRRFDRLEARMEIGLGSLGLRMGRGMEDVIRQVIESYSGLGPLKAERLTLIDEAGECLYPGATVEFDALVTNGRKFLVEVKSFVKPGDVSSFYRKALFAESKLGGTFEKVLIAPAATRAAIQLAEQLGIICHVFSVGE